MRVPMATPSVCRKWEELKEKLFRVRTSSVRRIRVSVEREWLEQSLFRSYTGIILHLFLCYIDDCIGVASCSHEELEQFIHFTNTFHPNLKFTWTISDTSLSFLDLSASISGIKKIFHVKQMFTCTSTNVVHCICGSRCGLLSIRETKRRLGDCFVAHLCSLRDKRQHLPVGNYFKSPYHSLDDMSILDLL
eukprot:g21865.t1